MYILQYDYVAFLLNIINLTIFLYKKKLRDSKSGVLFVMLINSSFTTIFDVLSTLAIGNPDNYSQVYCFLATNVYYFLNNNKIYILLTYVLMLIGATEGVKTWKKIMVYLPYFFTTIIIFTNPLTTFVFNIDSNLIYHRETGLSILYLVAFLHLVFGSIFSYRHIKKMEKTIVGALFFFVIIYMLSAILQTLFPKYLIQSFFTAINELIIIMVLQNRNEVIDGTTQLYNQNSFYSKLKNTVDSNISTSVSLIMIEDTESLNYTLGYSYLTKIIRDVAKFIKKDLKTKDCFYIREGCFAVLCINPTESRCAEIRNKLIDRFKENWIINQLTIKLSVKTTNFIIPDQIESYLYIYEYVNNFIALPVKKDVDKQIGVTEISFDTHFREQKVRKAVTLALEKKSFEVYYQPIYSVREQRFASAEALVRLNDPELGFVPPDEFIPITERDGTITKLGMEIFEMVCSTFNNYKLNEKGIKFIEINLSVVQCMEKNIKEQLLTLMKSYNINPMQICLEITETVSVNAPEIVRKLFMELDKLGVTFALDDYGSGYANINYILELPFNYVKLDKRLVWDYFEDDVGKITLESNIAMMKSLGIEMIAEGVETKEQVDALIKLGVNYLQGYYFSRPIPSEDFNKFIMDNNKL